MATDCLPILLLIERNTNPHKYVENAYIVYLVDTYIMGKRVLRHQLLMEMLIIHSVYSTSESFCKVFIYFN